MAIVYSTINSSALRLKDGSFVIPVQGQAYDSSEPVVRQHAWAFTSEPPTSSHRTGTDSTPITNDAEPGTRVRRSPVRPPRA